MIVKEIIVNAGELEKRVATLEDGRLMELDIEREPKIVGNIYKAKVTKVLKGMDAAFLDIGTEKNAFIAAPDAAPEAENEDHRHRYIPPITELLRANQEILVQVMRAPLGSKGARVTTHISLPGRYTVLMLNSGTHVGVSRKITNIAERKRLKEIANSIIKEPYSLIIRTEAEGKEEDELRADMELLLEIAQKVEKKAKEQKEPGMIHDDMTLVYRLVRDDFTRDVSRLVIDNEDIYNEIVELLEKSAPEMKERVFLYSDPLPIFSAYNIELEIERTLRRKVWLPSGGSLVVDQAEALTAIDVNTSKFVGAVELSETTFTTNLQAAEEVARQLRLRDLGGIIVVDFIDMESAAHREEVIKTFEKSLKRDRAKIKIHQISSLGLVEMTRKRTGESLTAMLTTPCPYCSGIGRLQNMVTMALKIEREIAKEAVLNPETEGFMLTAHPRVIATLLGNEGEAHRDLEEYLERPVYLRAKENFHPNTYQLELLTLEQALSITTHLEEGEVYTAKVISNDPMISQKSLVMINDIFVATDKVTAPSGAKIRVRIETSGTSFASGTALSGTDQDIVVERGVQSSKSPELIPSSLLPLYLQEERKEAPPKTLPLISPTAMSNGLFAKESDENSRFFKRYLQDESKRNAKKDRRKRAVQSLTEHDDMIAINEEATTKEVSLEVAEEALGDNIEATPQKESNSARRRRRRRERQKAQRDSETAMADVTTQDITIEAAETTNTEETVEKQSRSRNRRRRGKAEVAENVDIVATESAPEEKAAEPVVEATPTQERRGRRGRKPVQEQAETAQIAEIVEPITEAVPTREKRGRRGRRGAKEQTEAVQIIEIAEPIVATTEDATEKTKSRRSNRQRVKDDAPKVIEAAPTIVAEAVVEAENLPKEAKRNRGTRGGRRKDAEKTEEITKAAQEQPKTAEKAKNSEAPSRPAVTRGRKQIFSADNKEKSAEIKVESAPVAPPAEVIKEKAPRRGRAKSKIVAVETDIAPTPQKSDDKAPEIKKASARGRAKKLTDTDLSTEKVVEEKPKKGGVSKKADNVKTTTEVVPPSALEEKPKRGRTKKS